jgi:hypothetical protein
MQGEWNPNEPSQSSKNLGWLLDLLYPVPDPLRSNRDWERFCHEDLCDLTADELRVERARVVWILTFHNNPHPWLLERLDAIDGRASDVA